MQKSKAHYAIRKGNYAIRSTGWKKVTLVATPSVPKTAVFDRSPTTPSVHLFRFLPSTCCERVGRGGELCPVVHSLLKGVAGSGAPREYFTGSTIKHCAGQELNRYPPLAEYHRIAVRVEQLRCLYADRHERLQQRITRSYLADPLGDVSERMTSN